MGFKNFPWMITHSCLVVGLDGWLASGLECCISSSFLKGRSGLIPKFSLHTSSSFIILSLFLWCPLSFSFLYRACMASLKPMVSIMGVEGPSFGSVRGKVVGLVSGRRGKPSTLRMEFRRVSSSFLQASLAAGCIS